MLWGQTAFTLPSCPAQYTRSLPAAVSHTPTCWSPDAVYSTESFCMAGKQRRRLAQQQRVSSKLSCVMCARAAHAAVTCWLEHHQAGGVSHATAVMQYPCTPDLAHAALQVTRHMQQQRDACSHGQLTFAHAMSKMVLLCASHLARGGLSWSVYRLVGSSSAEVSTIDTQPSSSPTVRNLQLFATCNSRSRQGISRVSYATAAAVVVAARMADC